MQARGARGASIAGVVDGDRAHAKLVENALAAGRVAVAIACNTGLHIIVVDFGIEHGLDASFISKLGVLPLPSGLDELGQAHAEDVCWNWCHDELLSLINIGLPTMS